MRAGQFEKLLALQAWCRSFDAPLLVEILVPREKEREDEFEERLRPAMLAQSIRDAYARGLEPDYWKIEGTTSEAGAALVESVIAERGGRQIILGKGAERALIAKWFAAAASSATLSGFAIGRSVFWKPGTAFLSGALTAERAVDQMVSTYIALVDAYADATKACRSG